MYRFECPFCLVQVDEFRKIAERDQAPECHRREMRRVLVAPMLAVFTPYVTPAYDKETGKPMRIRTQAEHRAFLARNGLEEVGNDKSCAPPSQEEFEHRRAEKLKEQEATVFDFDDSTHHAQL